MAAASNVSIANLALSKLGDQRITSFADDNKPSRAVSAIFEATRDAELRKHRWNFAIRRTSLAALVATAPYPYANVYQLPGDCLRVDQVGDFYPGVNLADYKGGDSREYAIEGNRIATDYPAPLTLRYGARIEDPTQFDVMFVQALAAKLAELMAIELTGSGTRKAEAEADYKAAIREARTLDAVEDPPNEIPDDSWIACRL